MLLNNKKLIDLVERKSDFVAFECPMLTIFATDKCRPDLGPNNHLHLLKYPIIPCHYDPIYRYSSFFRKRGKLL